MPGVTEAEDVPEGQEPDATEEVAEEQTVELSVADIEALIEQRVSTAYQQWQREVQSQLDKRESGLSKRMREQIAQATAFAAAAKGRGLTDEQVAALQGDLVSKGIAALLPEEEEDDRKGRQPSQEPDIDSINRKGQNIFDKYELSEDDPEYKLINIKGSPEQYYESIRFAGLRKQIRVGITPPAHPAPKKVKGKAKPVVEEEDEGEEDEEEHPARIPGIGPKGGHAPVNPIGKITDRSQLYKMAAAAEQRRRQSS
jgi:hypothetical protein